MRFYAVRHGPGGLTVGGICIIAEAAEPEPDDPVVAAGGHSIGKDALWGAAADMVLTREELLTFHGGPEALERWYAQDDSVYERLIEEQVRHGREADEQAIAEREAERAKRRDHLRAL